MEATQKTTKEIQQFLGHEIKVMRKNLGGFFADGDYIQAVETGVTLAAYEFLLEWTTGVHG